MSWWGDDLLIHPRPLALRMWPRPLWTRADRGVANPTARLCQGPGGRVQVAPLIFFIDFIFIFFYRDLWIHLTLYARFLPYTARHAFVYKQFLFSQIKKKTLLINIFLSVSYYTEILYLKLLWIGWFYSPI